MISNGSRTVGHFPDGEPGPGQDRPDGSRVGIDDEYGLPHRAISKTIGSHERGLNIRPSEGEGFLAERERDSGGGGIWSRRTISGRSSEEDDEG
jgi:hypothetical protein